MVGGSVIVVKLFGGLGNQMFQYAAGRAAALRSGSELVLDVSWFTTQDLRGYALGHLPINARTLDSGELAVRIPGAWTGSGRLERLRSAVAARGRGMRLLVEHTPGVLDDRITSARDHTYLVGYWQSERYFAAAADQVRSELTANTPLAAGPAAVAGEIVGRAGVSLHVRRGDYTDCPVVAQPHGACSPDYYRRAMEAMDNTLGEPTYFAFSDDPEWVAANLQHPRLQVVSSADSTWGGATTDLRLMSLCHAHIISNSTFGWWGAWLATAGGPVIGPARWFADSGLRSDDIVPATWIRL